MRFSIDSVESIFLGVLYEDSSEHQTIATYITDAFQTWMDHIFKFDMSKYDLI